MSRHLSGRPSRYSNYPLTLLYFTSVLSIGILISSAINRGEYMGLQESVSGEMGSSLLYVLVLLVVVALTAYFVVRYFKSRLLHRFLILDIAFAFFISIFYILQESVLWLSWQLSLSMGLALTSAVVIGLTSTRRNVRSISYTAVGIAVGVLLSLILDHNIVPALLLAFALYDVFAVFKGPLRSIPHDFSLMLVDLGKVKIGLGDVTFYVLAVSSLNLNRGLIISLVGGVLILIGIAITISLLMKARRPLPGLTIPLILCSPLFFIY